MSPTPPQVPGEPATMATTLREQRKQGAIEHIAACALDLFSHDGFEATTIEGIAAAAGCSPRTFYRYFSSKEEVMFHDLPASMERLGEVLEGHLAEGLGPWSAVTETLVETIQRFEAADERVATKRMNLWLNEPALRVRYLQYVTQAEHLIADCLCRHRGTTPEEDDLAQIIAVAAIGAYRVTILTHSPARGRDKLPKHLRAALATLGEGLADET